MIYGVGVDIVEIIRFKDWWAKPKKSLQRILSDEEIAYCLANPMKSAERFAVRYAAREAFYKAYQSVCFTLYQEEVGVPFLSVCPHITIIKMKNGAPVCKINWEALQKNQATRASFNGYMVHISLSHTQTYAQAMIVISSVG